MYCQKCGNSVDEHLSYCNRCGAKLFKEDVSPQATANAVATNLSIAVGFTGLGGLGILVGLTAILLKNGAVPEVVVMLSVVYLATLFGICFMILRQISRLTKTSQSSSDEKQSRNMLLPPRGSAHPIPHSLKNIESLRSALPSIRRGRLTKFWSKETNVRVSVL